MPTTYTQEAKCKVRHSVIRRAVELLTSERQSSCCVRRSYVRDLYEYFLLQDESQEIKQVREIDHAYIREWESMHADYVGTKRVSELTVCYLSGPEPENDFNEFISLGVLPHNIWAFECERTTYLQALHSLDRTSFLQPKLIKDSIEHFFESTPKRFDIVYIDACALIVSDQHALRCISTMFKFHRLNSPGILISNFAGINSSNQTEFEEYNDIIARYYYIKNYRKPVLLDDAGRIRFKEGFVAKKETVEKNFDQYYGDFITAMVCNAGSITIPALRFANSNFLQNFSTTKPIPNYMHSIYDVNTIENNTLYKYIATNQLLNQANASSKGITRLNRLVKELSAYDGGFDLLASLRKLYNIRINNDEMCPDLYPVTSFFDDERTMYQFLDKPNRILFFDSVINQLSYPMHYCSDKIIRYSYVAKQTQMFTDLILLDECRYIYDWLPAIHQLPNAFSNKSWQYTFRFALDGLVKQRINYNNEFYFQGSVVGKTISGFESQMMADRIIIK